VGRHNEANQTPWRLTSAALCPPRFWWSLLRINRKDAEDAEDYFVGTLVIDSSIQLTTVERG